MSKRSKVYMISFVVLALFFYMLYFIILTLEAVVICGIISLIFGITFSLAKLMKICALISVIVMTFFSIRIHSKLIEVLNEKYPKE